MSAPATAGAWSHLALVSASQITLYRECARKWAWRYLVGIKTPQAASAALGTEVDDTQLQPYLRDDRPIDFTRDSGHIAAALLAYLPKPKTPGLEVQKHFVMPSPTWRDGKHIGFGFQGFIDLWLPDSALVPDMPGGAPFVGDFKTTSDLKWAKNEATLSTDVQAMLYATAAMFETKARAVDLSWMYAQTRGARKSKRTYLRVVSDHVAEQFGKINETAVEMLGVRTANPHPTELPPSPEQCEAYGGCPYRDKCNLSPVQIVDAMAAKALRETFWSEPMSNTNATSSLLERLKAQKAGAQSAPAQTGGSQPSSSPSVAQQPAPLPSPPAAPVASQAELAAYVAQNPRAGFLLEQGSPAIVGINPPESKLAPAAPTGVTQTQAAPAAPKRGPGRPRTKPQPDPLGADMHAATQPTGAETAATVHAVSKYVEGREAAPATTVNNNVSVGVDVDVAELVRTAKAVRAGLDAFLTAMGAS